MARLTWILVELLLVRHLFATKKNDVSLDLGPPCRKSPLLAALNVSGSHGQMLVVYSGKGWAWTARNGKGGKGKHHRKEKKKVMFLSDMWRFHLDTNQWHPIKYGDGPLGRWKEGAAAVRNNSKLVLMGGCTETSVKFARNDLWVFTPWPGGGGAWRRVQTANPPVPRRGHVLVANRSHLIMFGGKTTHRLEERAFHEMEEDIPDLEYTPQPGEKCLVDLWVISKDEVLADDSGDRLPRWHQGAPFPAGCRWGGTGSFIRDYLGKKYLAMFGGRHLSAGSAEHQDGSVYVYYNDVWLYDFSEDAWYEAPAKGARPCPRDHHGAATLNDKLYIYGGRQSELRSGHSVLGDVWSYDINTLTWTEHVPVGLAPSARFMPGVSDIFYQGAQHLAVFAGETLPGSTKRTTLNDLWVFNPASAMWMELAASTCHEKLAVEEEEELSWSTQGSPAPSRDREIGCLAVVFCLAPMAYLGIKRFAAPARAREMKQPFLG
ncbi:tea1 [Symbiodinium pilosum]|uniref:Tea1 protein n=1 Tax=Symbiodinium pilosum TaxID=2952 RepID=A0A812SC36_SYMPI|nr:tea1 [Symbiodinium pilosum]